MSRAPFLLALTSLKPHAGRTTLAMTLAWAFGRAGHRTLLVDANRYPSSTPGKSKTGSAELWLNVLLGSRKPGEAKELGAEVVLIDMPPLVEGGVATALGRADAALVSVVPIVQNKRFLPKAKDTLEQVDADRVLGWCATSVEDGNEMHRSLVEDLRRDLATWKELATLPSDTRIPKWDFLAAEEPPEGDFREGVVELAASLLNAMGLAPTKESRAAAAQDERAPGEESQESEEAATKPEAPVEVVPSAPRSARAEPRLAPAPPPSDFAPFRWFGRSPRVSLSLVGLDASFALRPGVELFPRGLPLVAAGPMVRCGLIHSLDAAVLLDTHEVSRRRLRPTQESVAADESELTAGGFRPRDDALRIDRGDGGPPEELARESGDARLISGLLELAQGRHAAAPEPLEAALADDARLGFELAQLGHALVADVVFGNGISTHFGANPSGVRLALASARLLAGDGAGCLEELDLLLPRHPDDDVLRALRVELLLERGDEEALRTVHRGVLAPSFETPLHVVLALYRAEALFRLGYGEAARDGLSAALDVAPAPSPLRHALLRQRAHVAEHLGAARDARRDLEAVYAEDPDDEQVGLRLAS